MIATRARFMGKWSSFFLFLSKEKSFFHLLATFAWALDDTRDIDFELQPLVTGQISIRTGYYLIFFFAGKVWERHEIHPEHQTDQTHQCPVRKKKPELKLLRGRITRLRKVLRLRDELLPHRVEKIIGKPLESADYIYIYIYTVIVIIIIIIIVIINHHNCYFHNYYFHHYYYCYHYYNLY